MQKHGYASFCIEMKVLPKWRQRRWRKCENKKESAARVADYSSHLHFFSWMLYHDHATYIKRVRFDTNTLNLRAQKNTVHLSSEINGTEAKIHFSQNTLELRRKGTKGTQKSSRKGLACEFSTSREHHVVLKMWWNGPKIGLFDW